MLPMGLGLTLASQVAQQAVVAPTNTVAPAITGSAAVGQVLTCSTGTWTGAPSYTFQWQNGGVNIDGETSNTYTPVSGDAGDTITCDVTATNAAGSDTATSNSVVISSFGAPFAIATFVNSTANANTVTITTTENIPAGYTIVLGSDYRHASATINSCTDSVEGGGWGSNNQLNTSGATLGRLRMWNKVVGVDFPPGTTITVTFSTTTTSTKLLFGLAFDGGGTKDKNLQGTTGTGSSGSTPIGTLSSAPQMVVGFLQAATGAFPITDPTGMTAITVSGTSGVGLYAGVLDSTTPSDPTWGFSAPVEYGVQLQSFALA